MIDFQAHLIFPVHAVPASGPLPKGAERLSLRTPGGETLYGIHLPSDEAKANRTLILGFGGNGWNGQDVAEYLHEIFPDEDVVAFHYRGYPPSTGSPSAEALIADAPLVYDAAVGATKPARVIAVGFSIGTGIAAQLAASRKLDGLILVTPFDSLAAVAAGHYRWLPVRLLLRHRLEPAAELRASRVPVAIVAGGADTLVPPARTDALRRAIPHLVFDQTIPNAGHNDIYADPAFPAAMRDAFLAVTAAR